MLRFWLAVFAIALSIFGGGGASAAVIDVFGTGLDANGNVVADGTLGDAHYTLTGPGAPPGGFTILAGSSAPGTPTSMPGPWLADGADPMSRWIGPDTPQKNFFATSNTNFTFSTTFDLTGLIPTTAALTGQVAADNNVSILLNGTDVGFGGANFGAFVQFSIASDPANGITFLDGINTLSFVVRNGSNSGMDPTNPMGLRVEVAGTAAPVPLPAAGWLLLSGLGVLGLARRRAQPA